MPLAVGGLLAIVAVASRGGPTGAGESAAREPSAAFLDTFYSALLALMAIGSVLLVWGYWTHRHATPMQGARGRANRVFVLLFAALLIAVLVAPRLGDFGRGAERPAVETPPAAGSRTTTQEETPEAKYEPRLRWLPIAVTASLATLALVVLTRRRARPAAPDDEALLDDLSAVVEQTLVDLRSVEDPRAAVIAAYARMEGALAAYGLARREAEAPLEYLERIAPALRDQQASAQRLVFELTHLYERAKFSRHEIDRGMKDDAIATLESLRDELARASAGEADA